MGDPVQMHNEHPERHSKRGKLLLEDMAENFELDKADLEQGEKME